MNQLKERVRSTSRRPKITVSEAALARLEALAEGAQRRDPALGDRLMEELTRARIVKPGKMPKNVVAIGSSVTYRDEQTGQEQSLVLVFPGDADIARNRVSIMTPIGVALLGLTEGATFHWDTRNNQRRVLTVVSVAPADTAPDAEH